MLEGGRAGGRVYLVDFGGVQAAAAGDALQAGSTIIGTYGYMAPEQFRGQATPASDLYGLGGTLLFALSGATSSANIFRAEASPTRGLQSAFGGIHASLIRWGWLHRSFSFVSPIPVWEQLLSWV